MDANETICKNPSCKRQVVQVGGGHRRREYCDDNCRQAAHRVRQEAYQRQQYEALVQTWGSFQPETVSLLAGLLYAGSGEFARRLAEVVRSEQGESAELDQRNIAAYQEKLTQAASRIEKLERQVNIQRQRLGQYYQRFYPSSLAVAQERLLALGASLNYRRLLKYNDLSVEIGSGAEAWREFAIHADYDQLSLAILQAQRFYDNLEAVRSPGHS
jgi:hypothetical protein